MNDMSEIEIEHQCYCSDNGYFCRYLDKASGLCIATTCKHAQELLQAVEIERLNKYSEEMAEGRVWLEGDKIHKDIEELAIDQLEKYGATTIGLDISEEDLNDIERSWANVRRPTEEN